MNEYDSAKMRDVLEASNGMSTTDTARRLVEIRAYRLSPGTRDDFHAAVTTRALPMVRAYGMDVVTHGPVPHDGIFTDFARQLTAIGERLLDLPPATRVLPGHGEEITIGDAVKRFDGWVTAGPGGEL